MKAHGGSLIPLDGKSKYKCRKWKLRVSTKNRLTGKYKSKYKTIHGSYTDACEQLREFAKSIKDENGLAEHIPTFEKLINEYLTHKYEMGYITEETKHKQKSCLNLMLIHIGAYPVNRIDPFMITDACKALKAGNTPSGKPASGTYINKSVSLTRGAFEYAIEHKYTYSNPVDKAESPKKDTGEKKALSDDQIEVLNGLLLPNERHHVAIKISLYSGLRIGELCALKWSNVDVQNALIGVESSMTKQGIIKEPKTESSKEVVPIPALLVDFLQKWRKNQAGMMEKVGLQPKESTFVLANRFGDPILPGQLSRWWKNHRDEMGCKGFVFHELRHTYISLLGRNSVDPYTMQKLARHKSIDTTMHIYNHVNMEQKRAAVSKFDGKK